MPTFSKLYETATANCNPLRLALYERYTIYSRFIATRLPANSQNIHKWPSADLVPPELPPNSHIRLRYEISYYCW